MVSAELWQQLYDLEQKIINQKCFKHTEEQREDIKSEAGLLAAMIEIAENTNFSSDDHRIAYLTKSANGLLTERLAKKYTETAYIDDSNEIEDIVAEEKEVPTSEAFRRLKALCPTYKPGDSYEDIKKKIGSKMDFTDIVKFALTEGNNTKNEIEDFIADRFPDFKYRKGSLSPTMTKARKEMGMRATHIYGVQKTANKILIDNPFCSFSHFCLLMQKEDRKPWRLKNLYANAKKAQRSK